MTSTLKSSHYWETRTQPAGLQEHIDQHVGEGWELAFYGVTVQSQMDGIQSWTTHHFIWRKD